MASLPSVPTAWRTQPSLPEFLVWPTAAVLGYVVGTSVVTDQQRVKVLLLLPVLVLALTIQPEKIFVAWLFAAPLVQGAASGTHFGHIWFKLFFLAPPLVLIARMAMGSVRARRLWAIDALPALYLAYVLVSVRLFPSEFTLAKSATVKAIYISIGVGIAAYYFVAFGRTSRRFPEMIAASLLWGGVVVAALGIVDGLTGWNLWHQRIANGDIRRAVSTIDGPWDLGTYLGVVIALAVAILVFRGPRHLRLPSFLVLGLAPPALYFTYTRGPVVAVAAVVIAIVLLANRARWPSLLVVFAVGVLVLASWGHLTSSTVYKERISVNTATGRLALVDTAFKLFRERPLFGQGYATFDQVKLTVPIPPSELHGIETNTSHNTFLTVLAESGAIGFALLVLPWLVIAWRALAAGWRGTTERWIVAGCVGAAAAYVIGASTYDARFSSLMLAVPWITLGLARKVLAEEPMSPGSAS